MKKKAMRTVGMEDGVAARDGGEKEVTGMEEEPSMLAVHVAPMVVLASSPWSWEEAHFVTCPSRRAETTTVCRGGASSRFLDRGWSK